MSNVPINLVIEPWTTANTHFNLHVENPGTDEEFLLLEFAGKKVPLKGDIPFVKLTFIGKYDPDGYQTGNLLFNIKTLGYTFSKNDHGIKPGTKNGDFNVTATLKSQTTVDVGLSMVQSEKGSFSFNFDLKNNNGGKSHLFDPEIEIGRPANPN